MRVFIGDADSGDNSVTLIQDYIAAEGIGKWAQCFGIGRNGGFAYGNNEIFRRFVAPDPSFTHVHFLNPDTYIRPGAVTALVRFLEAHRGAGVAGSRLENPDGSPQSCAFRFPAPWREFFRGACSSVLDRLVPSSVVTIPTPTTTQEADWVSGASFMMPRRVLDDVGLMDDGYFLYFEETDLMARVRRHGLSVWHVHDSRVVHLEGQSTKQHSEQPEVRRASPIWLQSRARFLRKHHGRSGAALGNFLFLSGNIVYLLHRTVRGRPVQNPLHVWRDYLTHGQRRQP